MALVCCDIEALPQNAADPAIRDRPFILEAISFDEYCHDVGRPLGLEGWLAIQKRRDGY